MNKQREVVYGYRNEVIDSEEPRTLIYEVIDEAVPAKVKEFLDGDEPNYAGLLHWVNTTFPLGLTEGESGVRNAKRRGKRAVPGREDQESLRAQISHEEPDRGESLERYIILNAIDRLWQEHLYAMDALREGVYLRATRRRIRSSNTRPRPTTCSSS